MAYTPDQVAVLVAAVPVTYADAVAFATDFGKTPRSVISKVKSLDLAYVPKPVAPKRPQGVTKAELVAAVVAMLGDVDLAGLEKAPGRALSNLVNALGAKVAVAG